MHESVSRRARIVMFVAATAVATARFAHAVINPGLQPVDLFGQYENVVACEVVEVDVARARFAMRVTRSFKGGYTTGQEIIVAAEGEQLDAFALSRREGELRTGVDVVAFVGRGGRRRRHKFLIYFGKAFCIGKRSADGELRWLESDQQTTGVGQRRVATMAGTWSGSTRQLIRMLGDIADGRSHFPRRAYARFKRDILLDTFDGTPIRGVGLYDVDLDGDLDVYACSKGGDRIYLQTKPMVFIDATERAALDCASSSCSFADVNLDGRPDLLAGGEVHLGRVTGHGLQFRRGEMIPAAFTADVKSAAFVELNGDGYPDVVLSVTAGGLTALLNPGAAGGAFRDATAELGLTAAACGTGGTGFFAPGDWNDDGRTDLFYAAGAGYLLIADEAGRFAPLRHDVEFSFASGDDGELGPTGAGCFAPIFDGGGLDLVIPVDGGWHVVENRAGAPVDVTVYGNEIGEASSQNLATLAEDLNLDGHVDLYTVSRRRNGRNRFIVNRGYGSFMLATPHKCYEHMFDGPAHARGGWGAAAGDVDGGGAPDLLVGNVRGELTLILNETLALRTDVPHPTDDIRRLLETTVLNVTVRGPRGLVGASVRVKDAGDATVARRDLGANVCAGSCGPDVATVAVRTPGRYTVVVMYADGVERSRSIDLGARRREKLTIERGER